MATIMGYQPGGPMPPGLMGMMGGGMPGGGMSGGMQGGMGMMGGMTGMQGMQGMGGYGMGMAGMQPAMGGMAGPQGMNGMPGGFLTAAHGGAEAFAGVAGPSTPLHGAQAGASEGQVDGEYRMSSLFPPATWNNHTYLCSFSFSWSQWRRYRRRSRSCCLRRRSNGR